jgi:hypothetical protein
MAVPLPSERRPSGDTVTPTVDTPTAHRSRDRGRRPGPALGAALAAALLLGASACATESGTGAGDDADTVAAGGFEATAEYLQEAADQSTAEGYRVELLFSLDGEIDDDTPPMMTGGFEGDRYHYEMDLGTVVEQTAEAMGESLPGELDGLDMDFEMAGDAETLYLRAPMFAQMGGGAAAGPAGDLAAMGDGWGSVDLAALGDQVPADLASAMGGQGIDPQVVVAMVQEADDVTDLGDGEVRGVQVRGLSAEVTMAEMLEASGQDPVAFAELNGGVDDGAAEALYDLTTPIDVWIDDDGYLRRMEFGYSMDEIVEAMGEDPADLTGAGLGDLDFAYALDMFDYGAELDFEAPDDAVDITDAFAALVQA